MNAKFTPSLEQFDQRDMPSASFTRPPIYAESVKLEIPGGCWPGPAPDYSINGIIIVNSTPTDAVAVKTAPGSDLDAKGIIIINNTPTADADAGSIIVIGSAAQKV
jgi:hypothetical protein